MIDTDLTAVSTHGWFADEGKQVDLLRAVGTFGWYGITVGDLVEFFKTQNFTLIISRLKEMGLEINRVEEIDPVEIMTNLSNTVEIRTTKEFNLTR